MQPRKLPEPFTIKLRTSGLMTLILITAFGSAHWANTATEKDNILKEYKPEVDTMLLAWTGQYRTDIFELTPEDLQNHYK